ncbi:MAG: nucleotidyltransferase [Proteobacteria bacterium]|nr:nucleotidyltransferase [Pseudomonadota bacterium]
MKASHFSKDIHQFLELLAKHKVKYVIVGGEAVIYYGYARLTGDVDFFFGTSKENAQCLYDALEEFWEGDIPGLDSFEGVMQSGTILQFGVPPNRIDLVNRIDGVTFEEAWTGKTTTSVEISGESIPVYFIGLDQLITNKDAIKRPKDLEDLKYLKKAKENNPS